MPAPSPLSYFVLSLCLLAVPQLAAEEELPDDPAAALSFMLYDPPSTLVVPETEVAQAKYPFIDVHSHQFAMGDDQDLEALVEGMDSINMQAMVNLSGRGFKRIEQADGSTRFELNDSAYLARAVDRAGKVAPERLIVFTNIDLSDFGSPGWSERAVAELEDDVGAGAQGLKIYKSLGMESVDIDGSRIAVNDPRLDPVWAKCGELGVPVLIHTADPAPFWQAKDADNERLYELIERPNRYRGPNFEPTFEELLAEQHAVFRRHPETSFINAHLGWLGNDLGRLAALLDELPNVYTEFGAVVAELGRQPRFGRKFLIDYQDRVMFGKDSWNVDEYPLYFRLLETADDYIEYFRRRHAFWRLYGLDLPDEVLKKIYYKNALRVIPGIDPAPFPE